MHKILTVLLAILIGSNAGLLNVLPVTHAQDTNDKPIQKQHRHHHNWAMKKEFMEEWHEINQLRIEKLELKAEAIKYHDELAEKYLKAKDSRSGVNTKKLKQFKRQIKKEKIALKKLHKEKTESMRNFRDALDNKDKKKAKTALHEVISKYKAMNQHMKKCNQLLSKMKQVLQ